MRAFVGSPVSKTVSANASHKTPMNYTDIEIWFIFVTSIYNIFNSNMIEWNLPERNDFKCCCEPFFIVTDKNLIFSTNCCPRKPKWTRARQSVLLHTKILAVS